MIAQECPALIVPAPAIEHAFALPGGERAVLRDPYGGTIFRGATSVVFAVRLRDAARRRSLVDHVEWGLDGAPLDAGGPYALQAPSGSFAAGEHRLTAHVVLRDGRAVDKTIDVRASDCAPVTMSADVGHTRAELVVDSGGTALRSVAFRAVRGVRARSPRSARGLRVGSLSLSGGPSLTLRLPRAGGRSLVLARRGALRVTLRPGARSLLSVAGLPGGTRGVRLTLTRGVVARGRACPAVAAVVSAAAGGAAAVTGGPRC